MLTCSLPLQRASVARLVWHVLWFGRASPPHRQRCQWLVAILPPPALPPPGLPDSSTDAATMSVSFGHHIWRTSGRLRVRAAKHPRFFSEEKWHVVHSDASCMEGRPGKELQATIALRWKTSNSAEQETQSNGRRCNVKIPGGEIGEQALCFGCCARTHSEVSETCFTNQSLKTQSARAYCSHTAFMLSEI